MDTKTIDKKTHGLTIFVMCAGDATRFGGRTKQLLSLGDTTILGRTLGLLEDHTVYVVTHHKDIQRYVMSHFPNATILIPRDRTTLCHSILSTQYRWTNRTIILLGDVIYARHSLQRILSNTDDTMFFGDLWETYGLSFRKFASPPVVDALRRGATSPYGKLRHAYRAFIHKPWNREESIDSLKRESFFCYIDHWITRDCDSAYEYDRIKIELLDLGVLSKE